MKELADAGHDQRRREVRPARPRLQGRGRRHARPASTSRSPRSWSRSLGIDPETRQVKWNETISDNREPFLEDGKVDLVLASYSITDERRAGRRPGRALLRHRPAAAGEGGQRRSRASTTSRARRSARSPGSTSLENVKAEGTKPRRLRHLLRVRREGARRHRRRRCPPTARSCSGYAAQNEGELKVVGDEFSEERIGVGYSQGPPGDVPVDHRHPDRRPTTTATGTRPSRPPSASRAPRRPEPPEMDACAS